MNPAKKSYAMLLSLLMVTLACNLSAPDLVTDILTEPPPTSQPTPVDTPSFTLDTSGNPIIDTTTREILLDTIVPISDPLDLAYRLLGLENIARTLPPPASFFQVGDEMEFTVTNNDTARSRELSATLQYVTEHVYFWIENSISFEPEHVRALSETFENEIYPTNRAFFGSEWTPGVDGDPHIYILVANNIGASVAGYFSSGDEFPPQAVEGSNGHEMFVLSGENLDLGRQFAFGVLAHEFQHMIHWNLDRNETSFINEGFSELAQMLNGYSEGTDPLSYLINPDMQFNDWPTVPGTSGPNYGASFLFVTYFLNRFGESATQALVTEPANGLSGVDAVLESLGITDPLSGQQITADDFILDWALANYINDFSVGDSRFAYTEYPIATNIRPTETISDCTPSPEYRNVHQYGVDYLRINCQGQQTLQFEGYLQTDLLPASAYSGDFAFWSNKGHDSDMTLTRTFDFTNREGALTFNFWTWYDIETDWDYIYLLASTDGENWEFLITPSGTDTDPSGNNYGWGYTDLSGGGPEWIQESIDISQYAGQVVQLRFEYITDTAVNGEGMLIDDISIPEIDYFADFEAGDDGWEANGFARVSNTLPQTFQIALITFGDTIRVEYISLDAFNLAEIFLNFDDEDEYILVILGTTRFTRQLANYSFTFLP